MHGSGTNPALAAELLRAGNCVALPTETVYGLAARADDPQAIRRIFEHKGRPLTNPLILHFSDVEDLEGWVDLKAMPEGARALMMAFWPGPLTLLLPRGPKVQNLVCAGLPHVAVRIPQHPMFRDIIRQVGAPLAAPSANPSGYVSPTNAGHVLSQYADSPLPFVLDGGPCARGVESTILGWTPAPTIYRLGALPPEAIEKVTGRPCAFLESDSILAPGMLPHHYAPHTPLVVSDAVPPADAGWITWQAMEPTPTHPFRIGISDRGDLEEAATHLYGAMIALDQLDLACIFVQPFPESGLGLTLNERIARAARRHESGLAV